MKTCPKCGRTSPPALAQCPRCKTPLGVPGSSSSVGQKPLSSRSAVSQDSSSSKRTVVMASILSVAVLIFCGLLYINKDGILPLFTGTYSSRSDIPKNPERLSNFHELLGVWSGREINGSSGWTFSFSGNDSATVSGPEGSYKGKAGIHWDIGTDGEVMKVPPGAGVLDVDIGESSAGQYKGKTTVGAFSISFGSSMKLCSGEPGSTKRPLTFEPVSGIRCFELTKTSEAPLSQPPAEQQAQLPKTDMPAAPIPAASTGEATAAREAFKSCIAAYKTGNMSEAKKCVSSKDLPEMEQSGMFDMAMGMMSGLNIDEFTPTQQGNRMIFKKSEKQGDMTSSMSINMIKEDGQWKFGK